MTAFSGCYTALITPMTKINEVDYEGLHRLVDFQIEEGVNGILAVGTTGESPTLDWNEHNKVTERIHEYAAGKCQTIAGTGSNSTQEAIEGTAHAQHVGIRCVLLVDPYYNGPSSLEIRREYIEPIARKFPEIQVIPYIIPGRTGTQLLPQDLAILHQEYKNVSTVKEATGNLENMRLTRKLCGADFNILSGDDDKTYTMMTTPEIAASGVISVVSNIAPRAVQDMTQYILNQKMEEARNLNEALQPLFDMVTVKTQEETPFGPVTCKARNPLACKTLMNVLGMPSGPCRRPLGKMTRRGLEVVLANARRVYEKDPEILAPIEDFFDVSLQERLYNERFWQGLTYA
ncbi:4-hydroxy-tetrahydrodipicolinate synthase [Candidatus Bathyarchaeota archaeon A05DMB-2]|nr:4-hydroxy-tetrahydrodipicolinate synthase [Candidatus Bathyarchaeota archaeon A05DMB-2]